MNGQALPYEDFTLDIGGSLVPIAEADLEGNYAVADDDARAWFVSVDWITTVAEAEAIKEVGFFGNQNTVANRNRRNGSTPSLSSKSISLCRSELKLLKTATPSRNTSR